jgi:hypothetical protein
VESDVRKLFEFLEAQREKQAPRFPTLKHPKVVAFLGTTSLPGTRAAMGVCPVLSLAPVDGSRELVVRLRGPLPRLPSRGECVTVHLTNVEQYQGYQVKTRAAASPEALPQLFEAHGPELTIKGAQLFTVHHSPYTMKFFEQIPFEEVQQTVGDLPFALVAVGEQANISPRFVFHHEVRSGRLVTYHGDGLPLKTYMNLKSNRLVTMLALDLDDFTGFALRGSVEELQRSEDPKSYDEVAQGFAAGSWGKPTRVFRFSAEAWEPIAPTGRAVKGKPRG